MSPKAVLNQEGAGGVSREPERWSQSQHAVIGLLHAGASVGVAARIDEQTMLQESVSRTGGAWRRAPSSLVIGNHDVDPDDENRHLPPRAAERHQTARTPDDRRHRRSGPHYGGTHRDGQTPVGAEQVDDAMTDIDTAGKTSASGLRRHCPNTRQRP